MPSSSATHPLQSLIEKNKQWAEQSVEKDEEFFTRLLSQQNPEYLWIGCSDSRVPANEVVGLRSGELFVHRNIANVVVHSDLNSLSVLQFAIDHLKVKHVMVVGHYGCSGVNAAMTQRRIGLADNWLRHIQDVHMRHAHWLNLIPNITNRLNAMVEVNAIHQAENVCLSTVVQDAWARGQELSVHGWAYALSNGLLQDLRMAVSSPDDVQSVFAEAIAHVRERYDVAETPTTSWGVER